MSYILDALKKADAEREQGRVPGLHTATAHLETDSQPLGRPIPSWVMGLVVALALTALGLAWWWTRPVITATAASDVVRPQTPEVPQSPTKSMATTSALPSTAPLSTTPVVTPSTKVQTASPVTQAEGSTPISARAQTAKLTPAVLPSKSPDQPMIHVDPATAVTASAKIPMLAELPEDVRRSLPALTVSGAMYSDQPANRMLLVNNRVFQEGDQPVAGLVLEEIRLKSAVFRYQGMRYAVSY